MLYVFLVRTVYSEYEDDAHCNAWAARHFTTFDGKGFTFPGEWTYTLVQEYVTTRPPAYSVLINMAYDCTESVECKIAVQVCNSFNSANCCDIGQIDRLFKIELIPSFVLSSDDTNCKNDIQLFPQLFDELSVHRDYH